MTHTVREATEGDAEAVIRLLDAAMMAFDRGRVRTRVREGDALAAVVRGHNREERQVSPGADASDGRVVGACVLRHPGAGPTEIEHIAVHRSRRGRGIGTALVEAADARTEGALVARFREDIRPFYESLGFEIDAVEEAAGGAASDNEGAVTDRLRGVLR